MNVAFIIDNSISMNQRAYNGLSLCEIAKNGVEFVIKQRLRSADSKYDTYHLFQTGFDTNQKGYPNGVSLLSSYKHDLTHFFFQLKNIKTHQITDLPTTLQNVYRQLNIFRFLNGADNLTGGRDPLKSDPSLIILFTDECNYYQLERVQELIRTNKLYNKWDSTIVIFELMLSSKIEKNILEQEAYRKQLQGSNASTKIFEDIANALGGNTVFIDNYEYLFQYIDTQVMGFFNKTRLNIYLQISCKSDQESVGFIESGIKEVFNPISNPLLPTKEIIIMKINAKLNKQFQLAKLKSDIQNNNNYSRILLPDKPAKIEDPKRPELLMNDYPKFIVDFSKIFHANMNKELEFEKQELELSEWSRLISPQITPYVKEKAYFPLYSTSEFRFNHEETQPSNQQVPSNNILIGLLKVTCREGLIIGIDLLYNVWNFLDFNQIYDEAIQKKAQYPPNQSATSSSANQISSSGGFVSSIPQAVEQELVSKMERYCLKTPFYYWYTIRKILVDKGLQFLVDHKYSFLYGDILHSQDEFVKNMLKFKQKEKKKLEEDTKSNRFNHSIKKCACCAPNSENYEYINRQMHPKSAQRVQLENLLCAKEEILFRKTPKIFDSSLQGQQLANKSLTLNLNQQPNVPYSSSGDIQNAQNKQINQNNNIYYLLSNSKLERKWIKDDQIKRIHFKSEPVCKMSELLRNVKQQEYREASIDDDEIKCIKEPMPFGNPFRIIARIKNSRITNQQNELISSEENYINSNINQGSKLSQNLLTNRMPKLKKLKVSPNISQQTTQVTPQTDNGNSSETETRIEGEIPRKKIKVSDPSPSDSQIDSDFGYNKSKGIELSSLCSDINEDQIYIVEKVESDEGTYESNNTDSMMYDPEQSNQSAYDGNSPSDQEEQIYTPEIPPFRYESNISSNNQYQPAQTNQKSTTQMEEEDDENDDEEEAYTPLINNNKILNYNNQKEDNNNNYNKLSYDYDDEDSKGFDSLITKKGPQYPQYNQQKIDPNEDAREEEQNSNEEYSSHHITDYLDSMKKNTDINYSPSSLDNYSSSLNLKKLISQEKEDNDGTAYEQGYNPDSEGDNLDSIFQENQNIPKKRVKKQKPQIIENKIKKFVYNKFVYDLNEIQKQNQQNIELEEEYNPNCIKDSNNDTKDNQFVKIEFSTKYLLSPIKKPHDFLIKQKDFFNNLLIIHKTYTREDLKPYVGKQLKEIKDQKLKDILKQRISEIVYIDKQQTATQNSNQPPQNK